MTRVSENWHATGTQNELDYEIKVLITNVSSKVPRETAHVLSIFLQTQIREIDEGSNKNIYLQLHLIAASFYFK